MLRILGVAALVGSTGCLPSYEASGSNQNTQPTGPTSDNTQVSGAGAPVSPIDPASQTSTIFNNGDPALLAAQAAQLGPLEVSSQEHGCMKMKFDTLGRLLQNRGVAMTLGATPATLPVTLATTCPAPNPNVVPVTTAQNAAYVYCTDALVLGLPQYQGRLSEATSPTTASTTATLDLFLAAASQIILNIGANAACKDASGNPAKLFNADNTCNESGVTCLQGYPATQAQIDLCSRMIPQATTIAIGQQLAVATILSATQTCE